MRLLRAVPFWCVPGGHVLDLGTGMGSTALFLANHGFQVDAIDEAASKIENLARTAATHGLAITARTVDLCSPEIDFANYDAVICTFALHFLETSQANDLLDRARRHARPGAVHALALITSRGELAASGPEGKFYPEPGELAARYRADAWTVQQAWEESRDSIATRADGTRMKTVVDFVLAQRR